MKQILLATGLIALPVAAFTGYQLLQGSPAVMAAAVADPLGDLAPLKTIAAEVTALAEKADLTGAEARITDLETAWDDAEARMRPMSTQAWGNVDDAIDGALSALRAEAPEAAAVTEALAAMTAALANPSGAAVSAGAVGVTLIGDVVVTDEAGRALPCEDLLRTLADELAGTSLTGPDLTRASDLQAKALERCNADDDTRADAFSAQALAALKVKPE